MATPPTHSSSAFHQLHDRVQRWVWQQNWTELRDIQEQAIAPILSGDTDVILSATTAGGKTEAAFLPIFSQLMRDRDRAPLSPPLPPLPSKSSTSAPSRLSSTTNTVASPP